MMYGLKLNRRISDEPAILIMFLVWIAVCIGVAYIRPVQEVIIAWFPQFAEALPKEEISENASSASIMMQDALRRLNIFVSPIFVLIFLFTDGLGTYGEMKRGFKWWLVSMAIALMFVWSLLFLNLFSPGDGGGRMYRLAGTRPGAGFFFAIESLTIGYFFGYSLHMSKRLVFK